MQKFALLALFMPLLAWGQTYDVVGLVMDSDRGDPLGSVQVLTKSGRELGRTNSQGRFEVEVNSRQAILVFRRHTYRDLELDLGTLPEIIGVEVLMESEVEQLEDVVARERQVVRRDDFQAQSIEELELFSGMKIDLNDHLRQLAGVSGMGEFSNDISVFGGRTSDATHYLGLSRIASLRHLDIGFPGNQSVLNPRVLRSISVEDNLARGPLNQGNSSALVYDLREGDPYNIHVDLVFGTINRELNMNAYWDGRTYLLSGRYLEPTFLANMGERFFTVPKDARIDRVGRPCDPSEVCRNLSNPIDAESGDLFFSTFKRDSLGGFGRHSLVAVLDSFTIMQDISDSPTETRALKINEGSQRGAMYAYEGFSPRESGDLQYSLSYLRLGRADAYRDTLPPPSHQNFRLPWYYASGSSFENLLGNSHQSRDEAFATLHWYPYEKTRGIQMGYGVELEYQREDRQFMNSSDGRRSLQAEAGLLGATTLLRMRRDLPANSTLEGTVGALSVASGLAGDDEFETLMPGPVASLRLGKGLGKDHNIFSELALRQTAAIEPAPGNRLQAGLTPSAEFKTGVNGSLGSKIQYAGSAYTRFYQDPTLPVPEVYWNYRETQTAEFANVTGGNLVATWLPNHHMGMSVNASSVQGDYYLKDEGTIPWESNRTLDLAANFRFLPRRDSLLSFIVTYGVNNGVPLYEYAMNRDGGNAENSTRTVRRSSDYPSVSRQRTDIRINLNLKSGLRPLDTFRFFFEADNIFAHFDDPFFRELGGDNQRRRGWTRSGSETNDVLKPVVTRGMGLFILFGFEAKLLI